MKASITLLAAATLVATGCKKAPPPEVAPLTVTPQAERAVTPPPPPPPVVASPGQSPPPTASPAQEAESLPPEQEKKSFDNINQILNGILSTDPATRSKAQAAIGRLTPRERQEFERLKKYYLGK